MALLEASGIGKNFGETHVLKDISLDLEQGEALAIIGSSGSGKTTLLRCLNFLERPDTGVIKVNGETMWDAADPATQKESEIRKKRLHFGLVFQNFNLFPQYTALQNVMLAGELLAKERPEYQANKKAIHAELEQQARELLAQMGLSERAGHYPHQLSGGQQQRVAIARALALRPSVLLADEATSGLDPQATASVLTLLKRLRDEYQLAIVLITHEMDAVRSAADAVAEIRDGTIVQYGRLEDLLARPDSLLGQQLLPLTPAAAAHSDLLLRLSYRWDVLVATDWISRLSQQWALQIDLLGGHVEVINGRLAGRLQVGVRFQGERLSPARLQGLLSQLGMTAEILDSAPLLREAV